ncbi:uncharacterized protein I303_107438 [Kwoniella dejecticola CBS 10117]|uniref:Uncharacterized protein n=1 Tax=Kwoniella dejecticola CBS 10117 TaxID=1296121 RepID=A0A1A5ZZQ0_9TREE|nr:uncharacterized protein I303_06842 [Kwoniella dejecticola CBS 10117]OBR83279.1 hypothetical protein I303_06842 [Kwoniella dejecticola CBS 10117]
MAGHRTVSPDPLALAGSGGEEEAGDCIIVTSTSPKLASTPSKRRYQPVVEIVTPKKRKKTDENTPRKTPISKASKLENGSRASPTPNGKIKPTPLARRPHATNTTPTKKSTPSASNRSANTPKLKGTPTLASSLKNELPTPSPGHEHHGSARKRPRISTPAIAKTLTFNDGIFDSPEDKQKTASNQEEITREAFLANEALKRQREARNFTYEGEASAPKLTRSGRVVGQDSPSIRHAKEIDEYGGTVTGPAEDMDINPLGIEAPVIPDVEIRNGDITGNDADVMMDGMETEEPSISEIPDPAKAYLRRVLSMLNSQGVSTKPPPFIDEEKNEALSGIVNLLKGTVERGEGNSALVVGPRGVGKTRTVARALNLLPSSSKTSPIIVRLSGLAQTNDKLAIREMGRQIAEAEGKKYESPEEEEDENNEEEYAPTTLPSHLLALLTQPSPRAIIIVIEEFDLFTEHARQALLYCLLDVVQSIKTGPVESTGRGVAVLGVTTRVDTLLLLEKRVKSRFSHRTFRIPSPLSAEGIGWKPLLHSVLIPVPNGAEEGEGTRWQRDWEFAIETLLKQERMRRHLDRLTGLTTDVRNLYRPFIHPITSILSGQIEYLSVPDVVDGVLSQIEGAGWGIQLSKLRGLPHPALGVLIISKHLSYAGREEFNFAQVEEEYLRFSRTKLVGSGKVRWPVGVLRNAYDHLLKVSLLIPASNASVKPQFQKVRCTLSPHEIVGWFKGEGANVLGPELANWGRMQGGHV